MFGPILRISVFRRRTISWWVLICLSSYLESQDLSYNSTNWLLTTCPCLRCHQQFSFWCRSRDISSGQIRLSETVECHSNLRPSTIWISHVSTTLAHQPFARTTTAPYEMMACQFETFIYHFCWIASWISCWSQNHVSNPNYSYRQNHLCSNLWFNHWFLSQRPYSKYLIFPYLFVNWYSFSKNQLSASAFPSPNRRRYRHIQGRRCVSFLSIFSFVDFTLAENLIVMNFLNFTMQSCALKPASLWPRLAPFVFGRFSREVMLARYLEKRNLVQNGRSCNRTMKRCCSHIWSEACIVCPFWTWRTLQWHRSKWVPSLLLAILRK